MKNHRLKLQLTQSLILFSVICVLSSLCLAEVPHLINYQGKLTDQDGQPLEGSHEITFTIYDAATGPGEMTPWQETHQIPNIQKGVFSVMLGSESDLNLAFDKPYWLAVEVEDDGEMDPRQRITSVGYALKAERAEEVDSLPQGIIAMWKGAISDIPAGWALCDGGTYTGSDGAPVATPNLTDKFIVGAGSSYGVGNFGGSSTIEGSSFTFHGIEGETGEPSVDHGCNPGGNGVARNDHTHDFTPAGTISGTVSNLPPYYALAYIMKL